MKKRDRREVERYVRFVADEMELRDWTIILMSAPCSDDEALAHVSITYGQKRARVWLCEEFRGLAPEMQRDTLVHELIHVHLESACNIVQNDLKGLIGEDARAALWKGFQRQVEYGVDGLAKALAKHLPLIEWPT